MASRDTCAGSRPEFENDFEVLSGFRPLLWQKRLFIDYLGEGLFPAAVDIPTGLGKTAVMALWLIARAYGAHVPRRLVYVVDRRAVVDQATEFAVLLQKNLESSRAHDLRVGLGLERSLPISTLRGQYVDNREWLEDPTLPAIIVGTVDMVGSRLLFEGYGVSRKMRPYHAGLLGADTLVVLDEAHLVPPFEKLLECIEYGSDQFGPREAHHRTIVPAFRLLSLSATGREGQGTVFRLEEEDIANDDTVEKRLRARKTATLVSTNDVELDQVLAAKAWQLADEGKAPIRCVVFCDKRDIAEKTEERLAKLAAPSKKGAGAKASVELFVGARRVFEREQAARRLSDLGFLAGSNVERLKPAFLIATSAGEVGVDLDADHLVCDLVAWERMIQRLGRVNRRGDGNANVVVIAARAAKEDDATWHERFARLRAPFDALPSVGGQARDASPGAIRDLKLRAHVDEALRDVINAAITSTPLCPALTRALVDAWSMTSLKEHTGRPEVAPWLRGWVDDPPQTQVVWRAHLPVRLRGPLPTDKEIEDFFEAAPVHASEVLETQTTRVVDWLVERAREALSRAIAPGSDEREAGGAFDTSRNDDGGEQFQQTLATDGSVDGGPTLRTLGKDSVVAVLLSASGDLRESVRLIALAGLDEARVEGMSSAEKETAKARKQALRRQLSGATLVLDARLGGLSEYGLLHVAACGSARAVDDGQGWLVNQSSEPAVRFRVRDVHETQRLQPDGHWRERFRFDAERTEEGEAVRWLVVEKWRQDPATEEDRSIGPAQTLAEHQSWTERKVRELAAKLGLNAQLTEILALAARLHDEGKRAERWQYAFNAPRDGAIYAKTQGPLNWRLLEGYRHEFGSLRYALDDAHVKALSEDLKDLVLHLIAAHHGQARPLISNASCEDAPPSALQERTRDVALRFARLQRRWGPWGLAWLEALLRAADQQASRENDARTAITARE